MNGRSPSPSARVKLTLQPRTLGGEIRIIDHLAVSVLTAPMGSATSPFIVDDAIVGLPQPVDSRPESTRERACGEPEI